MRVLFMAILLFIYALSLQAKGASQTYNYFYNVEVQCETGFQRKAIINALNDMLTLDTAALKNKRYPNYTEEGKFWTIIELIHKYFVPDDQNKTLGVKFYKEIKNSDVTDLLKKIKNKLENGTEVKPETPDLIKFGKSIDSFIPEGWKLIKSGKGDLNNDGLEDICGIIEYNINDENNEESPPRILFIALKEKDIYHLSIQTDKAIMPVYAEDPLTDFNIEGGSMVIKFWFGDACKYDYTFRFRFQNSGWYLTGSTINSSCLMAESGTQSNADTNYLTGIMIKTTVTKEGEEKKESIKLGKKKLVSLIDFDISQW
jgi:hypothetical protein